MACARLPFSPQPFLALALSREHPRPASGLVRAPSETTHLNRHRRDRTTSVRPYLRSRPRATSCQAKPRPRTCYPFRFPRTLCVSLAIFLMALPGAILASDRPPELTNIKVGYIPYSPSLPLFVAIEEKLLDDVEVPIELLPMPSSAEALDQLDNDALHVSYNNNLWASFDLLANSAADFYLTLPAVETETQHYDYILVRANLDITSARDLRGRRVGIRQGTIDPFLASLFFREAAGFELENYVQLPDSDLVQRMRDGRLDALVTVDPVGRELVESGEARVLVPFYRGKVLAPFPATATALSRAFVDDHPEVATSFVLGIWEAVQLLERDEARYKHLLSERIHGLTPTAAQSVGLPRYLLDASDIRGDLERLIGLYVANDKLAVALDPSTTFLRPNTELVWSSGMGRANAKPVGVEVTTRRALPSALAVLVILLLLLLFLLVGPTVASRLRYFFRRAATRFSGSTVIGLDWLGRNLQSVAELLHVRLFSLLLFVAGVFMALAVVLLSGLSRIGGPGQEIVSSALLGVGLIVGSAGVIGIYLNSLVLTELRKPIRSYQQFAELLQRLLDNCQHKVVIFSQLPTLWLPFDLRLARKYAASITRLAEDREVVLFSLTSDKLEPVLDAIAARSPVRPSLTPAGYKRKSVDSLPVYAHPQDVFAEWADDDDRHVRGLLQKFCEEWTTLVHHDRGRCVGLVEIPFLFAIVDEVNALVARLEIPNDNWKKIRVEGSVLHTQAEIALFVRVYTHVLMRTDMDEDVRRELIEDVLGDAVPKADAPGP